MPFTDDSSPTPLDGETPLTPSERRHLRKILLEDERMSWLRRKLKIFTPWIISVAAGLWAAGDWISKHYK